MDKKCKGCGSKKFVELENGREKCQECGKLVRLRAENIIKREKFHEEIDCEPLGIEEIVDKEIIVFDVSKSLKSKKSKYKGSTSRIILFSFPEKEDIKYKAWIPNGIGVNDICNNFLEDKILPDEEGIEITFYKRKGENGSTYWYIK